MLYRKLWRTMRLYKAQFLSMIIMVALGIGVFIGFNMEWVSIEENTGWFFEKTGFADYRLLSESGFSSEESDKVNALTGVSAAARYLSLPAEVGDTGDTLSLTVTEDPDVSGCMLTGGGEPYDAQSEDGMWLSDRYAEANGVSVGDTLTVSYGSLKITCKVKGLVKSGEYLICVRDASQLMPDYTTYGFAYVSPAFYQKWVGTALYPEIHVLSDLSKKEFSQAVDQALGKTVLVLTRDEVISYAEAMGEAEEGKTMGSVLPALFLLIAGLTMVTTMHRLAIQEKTQIGTLKALGFKDRRVLRHYTSYALMIGVLGSAIGLGLGYLIAWAIMNPDGMMGTYLDMPQWKLTLPWFLAVIPLGMILLLALVGYLSVYRMLRGTAAESLRPYTPKKMKTLFWERTRLWSRFGFGTRWNLRDILRHKSRTMMSLIGVIGCMVLLVGGLGMSDTVDGFLDLYYNGATNYATRLFLSEEASAADRAELIERYAGDYSASISVQVEDKAVSLDVYGVEHDKVRFPDEQNRYVPLRDDGAYVCLRLAEEWDLKEGDTFTVSPYGSDSTYTLTMAGSLRSVSENVVISPAYAEKQGIAYMPDSIYTDTEKADVAADSRIKAVQSKQAIIDSFDTFMDIMNLMVVILILAAVVLGIVVLYNLGVMSYTERYREMATLKVVGFRDKKIGRLLIEQNLWITCLGVVIGLPAGIGVLEYLLVMLASEYEMKLMLGPVTYVVSILLTFGVSLAVGVMVARKNRRIDMVEALKGAE